MFKKRAARMLVSAAMAVGVFAAGQGQAVYAQASEQGLKDVYAKYFRIGTCYPSNQSSNAELKNVILREFNSVTHENELKPDATMTREGSTDDDIKVRIDNARAVMQFCVDNNIPLRGHALVWHQQTEEWFFKVDFQSGGAYVTPDVMYRRLESYMKNLFALIKKDFPTLKLYAYDVINEIYKDDGTPRDPYSGTSFEKNGNGSAWVTIFGGNTFVDSAFTYARRYAPEGCKLFYNDFNEYHPNGKRDTIAAMATRLKASGVLDGIGMQSHLSTGWPDVGTYKSALNRFIGTGVEIHVTELDLTIEDGGDQAAQTEKYKSLFQAYKEARENGANITSVSLWGVRDDLSWRSAKSPLLFTQDYTKKPAYTAIEALVPQADWGDGTNPSLTPPAPTVADPDANGYYFYHDFEDGTTQGWARRGDETVANSSAQKNSGTKSIYVSNRKEDWNGAKFALPGEFVAGKEYSFSAMARHESSSGTPTFKLSMQYDAADGTTKYADVAVFEDAPSGQWVQLKNTAFLLPAGGTGFSIYVELSDANASFYVDDAMGGVKGATINPDGTPGEPPPGVDPPEDPNHVLSSKNLRSASHKLVTLSGKQLSINAAPGSKVAVKIVNVRGKTVARFNANGGENLSLRKMPAGVYIVDARSVGGDGRRMASKLILK